MCYIKRQKNLIQTKFKNLIINDKKISTSFQRRGIFL